MSSIASTSQSTTDGSSVGPSNGLSSLDDAASASRRGSRQSDESRLVRQLYSFNSDDVDAGDDADVHEANEDDDLADGMSDVKLDDDDDRSAPSNHKGGKQKRQQQAKRPPRSKRKENLLKNTVHTVVDEDTGQEHKITSWKMADYAYKQDPCPFPTRARGLFTSELPEEGGHLIVARGYNKFFNVGEVSWTKWDAMADATKGPYYLTLKTNGCIILISAMSHKRVLITSKHSIGKLVGKDTSHAQRGEEWLEVGLAKVGRTKEELAAYLWNRRMTAVAELCDDSFEEHVLGYAPEETGLHLHGLNHNTKHLYTHPPDEVADFARKWGFIVTPFEKLDTIEGVKSLADECSKTGKWNDQWVEGFVVRATSTARPDRDDDVHIGQEHLRAFMWKVKFDEPYLMWREWRETTKRMLTARAKGAKASARAPSAKGRARTAIGAGAGEELYGVNVERIKRAETRLYVRWVAKAMDSDDPELQNLFETYREGKGILAIRERFHEWLESEEGQRALAEPREGAWGGPAKRPLKPQDDSAPLENGSENEDKVGKVIIAPIAIPGCGKTLIGLALSELFGWGHTQSDDIASKKSSPKTFINNVKKLLQDERHSVVYADKNNHLRQHRQQLYDLTKEKGMTAYNVRLIALVWEVDVEQDKVLRICRDRITDRGERHQSLRPTNNPHDHHRILAQFRRDMDSFNAGTSGPDGQFSDDIRIPVDASPREMLDLVIERLAELDVISDPLPSAEQRDAALANASGYSPTLRREMKPPTSSKSESLAPRYYGITVHADLSVILPSDLRLPGPIQSSPHLTLVHSAELPARQAIWDACKLEAEAKREVTVILGPRLGIVTNRVASLEAAFEPADLIEGVDASAMHATVTTGPGVKPVAGKHLSEAMRAGHATLEGREIEVVDVGTHRVRGVAEGLVS